MTQRQHIRVPIGLSAICRYGSGFEAAITIADLSEAGCRILQAPTSMLRGEVIVISFSDYEYIEAKVRWLRDGEAGVQFLRPIDLLDRNALQRASELGHRLQAADAANGSAEPGLFTTVPHEFSSEMTVGDGHGVFTTNAAGNDNADGTSVSKDILTSGGPARLPISDMTRFITPSYSRGWLRRVGGSGISL
ncbi:PilZ domain-containing protein [Croceicoccus naphthovorans]|uniref:Uncharacterized protein n=1 Tax=Croceicoccus naphthovorans TaxID=1348774 RepID=A0A0G3XC82_9SPHN|nr:PilZ domain-containing protein [Croceicoccus naphthovorans]AKM08792.1 hypothetical protein AB433_00345 [Croceicoccus naphthovorans]MBB3992366.1 hypothetical protein [Croceicoccus naphthovorans]